MYLIIINPTSGGNKNYKKNLDIIVNYYGSDLNKEYIYVSKAKYSIRDYMQQCKLDGIQKILVMGGDGTFSETIHGLLLNKAYIDHPVPCVPVGGGSGNGLITSILRENKQNVTVLNALKLNKPQYMDLATIQYKDPGNKSNERINYSFLSINYGFVSDLDIGTEFLRSIGDIRFSIGALWNLLWMTSYRLTINYMDDHDLWHNLHGQWIMFLATNTSHISTDFLVTESAKLDDGYYHVRLIPRGISRWSMVKLLLNLHRGSLDYMPGVIKIKTKQFRIKREKNTGILTIDGEMITEDEISVNVNSKILISNSANSVLPC
jgi:sphingosine kinase